MKVTMRYENKGNRNCSIGSNQPKENMITCNNEKKLTTTYT